MYFFVWLRAVNDLLIMDAGNHAAVILLDLSGAFDTTDPSDLCTAVCLYLGDGLKMVCV